MTRSTAQLRLAIDIGSEPISGWVSDAAGDWRPFEGWVELTSAIEAARAADVATGESASGPTKTLGSIPGANASGL